MTINSAFSFPAADTKHPAVRKLKKRKKKWRPIKLRAEKRKKLAVINVGAQFSFVFICRWNFASVPNCSSHLLQSVSMKSLNKTTHWCKQNIYTGKKKTPLFNKVCLHVNIWKYKVSLCVRSFLSYSVCVCVCLRMIKWVHRAAGETTPTWGPSGEVLDLAKEEQEALSKAQGTTKTSAAQKTPQREEEALI